jgi:hypothetical protein
MGAISAVVLLALILWGHDDHRASYDQSVYHLPTIQRFASELPRPNLSDYNSATTPGYHLILAIASRVGGFTARLTVLKLLGAVFTVGLICTTAYAVGMRRGISQAIVLTMPILCSLYVISSGVWLLPDNAAWWGVAGVMAIAMGRWRGWRTILCGGLLLLATVLMRQSHLWCAAPLWAAAAFAPDDADDTPRAKRVALMVLATAPAFAATLFFFWLWGGPTPPAVREVLRGGNPAAPALVLSLIGLITPFFFGYLWPSAGRCNVRVRAPATMVGAAVGVIVGAAPVTSYSMAAGRWSGLWNAVKHVPLWHDRSWLIIMLASAGGFALAMWAIALPRRIAIVFLIAWAAFIAAQSANAMAFQRYYEPMLLISLALGVAHLRDEDKGGRPMTFAWTGPLLLALFLALITAITLHKGTAV